MTPTGKGVDSTPVLVYHIPINRNSVYQMAKLTMAPVPKASESVYQTLFRAIVEGELEPGEPLSDRALALQLGVSRTPIREAFHQLEAAGLVRRRGRIGWVVTAFDRRDVEELIELRTVLEVAGVRKVVELHTADINRIAGLFDGFSLPMPAGEIARYLAVDHELHLALIGATENRRIIEVYRHVEWHIDRVRHFVSYSAHRRVDESLEEHLRICRALKARDADEATRALSTHLLNVRKSFLVLFDRAMAEAGQGQDSDTANRS